MEKQKLNLNEAIHYLYHGKLDKKTFLDSAIGETFYDERWNKVRNSEKKECEEALSNYKQNPTSQNMVEVISELADLYVKELKAQIIYKDERLSTKIANERLKLQMMSMSSQIPVGFDALHDVAEIKYVSRAQNLIEQKNPKDFETEKKLITQYLNLD
ncbi:MAG: hypothetical protein ACMXX9_02025 [Candidatus Woesearchaeota archaeon]